MLTQLIRHLRRTACRASVPKPPVLASANPTRALFDQGQEWVGPDGVTHLIADLDSESRTELAEWLERNVNYIYGQVLARELTGDLFGDTRPTVSHMLFMSAHEWLYATELMRSLRRDPTEPTT